MDANYTYFGDYFAICTNIGSLCCIPEMNIMLYANYISITKGNLSSMKNAAQKPLDHS